MHTIYLEERKPPSNPATTLAVDISKHLQHRQYLGIAIVICDSPVAMLSAIRKQWVKATRQLQKLRASTLNAEEILRLTHVVIHMQNWQFSPKNPIDYPGAGVYFMTPNTLAATPNNCYSAYITTPLTFSQLDTLRPRLPDCALVIDYSEVPGIFKGIPPKSHLEQNVTVTWRHLKKYLAKHDIVPEDLVKSGTLQLDSMDRALDILLKNHSEFLQHAAFFQQTLNYCQPFTIISKQDQKMFEAVTRLAHRVQALSPGTFNGYLTGMFGDVSTDSYFLRDAASELYKDLELVSTHEQLLGSDASYGTE